MTDFPFVYETKLVSSTSVEKSREQVIRILKIGEWLKEHVGDDNYISDIYPKWKPNQSFFVRFALAEDLVLFTLTWC